MGKQSKPHRSPANRAAGIVPTAPDGERSGNVGGEGNDESARSTDPKGMMARAACSSGTTEIDATEEKTVEEEEEEAKDKYWVKLGLKPNIPIAGQVDDGKPMAWIFIAQKKVAAFTFDEAFSLEKAHFCVDPLSTCPGEVDVGRGKTLSPGCYNMRRVQIGLMPKLEENGVVNINFAHWYGPNNYKYHAVLLGPFDTYWFDKTLKIVREFDPLLHAFTGQIYMNFPFG